MTDNPGVGDILCHDENRKYRFIQLDTFHAGTFPSAWETLGVVAMRKGNQVWIIAKENASKKFMDVYPYLVTGYELDGVEHTAQFRLHGKPSTSTYYEFKYTTSTDEEFVGQLKQFLTANGETDWSAYIKDGAVYLQYDNYTSAEYPSSSITQAIGITLGAKVRIDYPEYQPDFRRKCGNSGQGIWHAARAKEELKTDWPNSAYNPAKDVTSVPSYPVCWPAFAGISQYREDHCLYLRQRYCKDQDNPTIAEWEMYIEDITHSIPCMIGGHATKWRDGKTATDRVKDITYTAPDGTDKPLYPAADYCSKFFDGKGYMPSVTEFCELMENVTYGLAGIERNNADPINRSLQAIGGAAVSCKSSYWMPVYTNNIAVWNAHFRGCIDSFSSYESSRCIPVLRLDLPVE